MLRLFKVVNEGEPVYFNNKQLAKVERDALREAGKSAVVMRGPDHWKGESFNKPERTPKTGRRRRR